MTSRRIQMLRTAVITAGVHASVVVLMLAAVFVHGCLTPPRETHLPVELIIEAPAGPDTQAPAGQEPTPVRAEDVPPTPESPDIPPPKPPPPKPPETEPKPTPHKVEVSKVKVTRQTPTAPASRTRLSAEEVARLLDRGAKIGTRPTLSDADLRRMLDTDTRFGDGAPISRNAVCMEIVRQALYRAWNQPVGVPVGLVARAEIALGPDGTLRSGRVVGPSGNAAMDESVRRALDAVGRIHGLPADFLLSHRTITVAFELTGH